VLVISGAKRSERWLDALRERGYECDVVQSAEVGVSRLAEGGYDLLLWDMDARERAAQEDLESGRLVPLVPTILLVPRGGGPPITGTRRTVAASLAKPVDGAALVAAVDEVLAVARARRVVGEVRRMIAAATDALDEVDALLDRAARRWGGGRRGGRLPLSAREEEIARALARGHRVAEIARMLDISPHTVRNHFKAIFRKLDVHSQVQLVARLRGDA
jgi:DNA-binding NarL/FixJ family response regulator